MVSVSIILKRARNLINSPEKLSHGCYARDKNNQVVQWDTKQAIKFCTQSAIWKACMGYPSALERQAEEALAKSIGIAVEGLTAFSDTSRHVAVMEAYENAIVTAYCDQEGVEEDDTPPVIVFDDNEDDVIESEEVPVQVKQEPEKKKRGRPKKVFIEEEPTLIGPLGQFFS